jgi:divalent metal cation (Fe/Co/Zn/Cd) transporter
LPGIDLEDIPKTLNPPASVSRAGYVQRALRLVTLSVAFGLVSGAVSIATGLRGHSLGVFAIGLGVLADVTGSATLIWRFRAELREPALSDRRERQSAVIVSLALAVVAVVLTLESAAAWPKRAIPPHQEKRSQLPACHCWC